MENFDVIQRLKTQIKSDFVRLFCALPKNKILKLAILLNLLK